jgi:hypothetical protein
VETLEERFEAVRRYDDDMRLLPSIGTPSELESPTMMRFNTPDMRSACAVELVDMYKLSVFVQLEQVV